MGVQDLKVLLVDDDPDDRLLIRELLKEGKEGFDYRIREASGYAEALSLVEEDPGDLLLIDHRLGQKTGLELMQHLRERGLKSPVVVLTGHGDEELAVSAMKSGAADYLCKKDLSSQVLHSSIRYVLEARRAEEAQNAMRAQLRASEAMYRSIIETTGEGFWLFDEKQTILSCNDALCHMLGTPREEVLGKKLTDFVHPEDHGGTSKAFYALSSPGQKEMNLILKTKNEEKVYVILKARPLQGDICKPAKAFAFLSDVTRLKEAEARLAHLAYYDALTGLPNRLLCFDRLEQAMFRATRYVHQTAILYIDLDGFKSVNDLHGHDIGDKVLKEAATRMRRVVRQSDTTGRLSGDEFLIILQDISKREEAGEIARKIIKAFRAPFYVKGPEWIECDIGVSIGISLAPINGSDKEQILRNADMAMYAAKQSGRNHYQFFK